MSDDSQILKSPISRLQSSTAEGTVYSYSVFEGQHITIIRCNQDVLYAVKVDVKQQG